jgi:hypothetical protein
VDDVLEALELLRPTFDAGGDDGFVSIEVGPELAGDTEATIAAARDLHGRIAQPNLYVKIPATSAGVPAIRAMIGEGRSINITLIFSLTRYEEVIEAYLSGLETLVELGGDLSAVHSVASFFVSRVDTEVDRRLQAIGSSARPSATPPGRNRPGQGHPTCERVAVTAFANKQVLPLAEALGKELGKDTVCLLVSQARLAGVPPSTQGLAEGDVTVGVQPGGDRDAGDAPRRARSAQRCGRPATCTGRVPAGVPSARM